MTADDARADALAASRAVPSDDDTALMRQAARTLRLAEHHWPADLLMQAADTIDLLRRQHQEQTELITDLRTELRARTVGIKDTKVEREWLAEHDRQVAEKAWDQGHAYGVAFQAGVARYDNPHRKQP